jgi:hypothetical protein
MSDPLPPDAEPGPQAGGERRRLDRAPGERFATGPAAVQERAAAGRRRRRRAVLASVLVADAGAVLFFLLGLVDLGAGLLVIAAFVGWIVALALVWWGRDAVADARLRVALAAFLGGWAIVAGIVVDWVYALVQGGVLGPLDYVAQRYGAIALLAILLAAGVAAVRAR